VDSIGPREVRDNVGFGIGLGEYDTETTAWPAVETNDTVSLVRARHKGRQARQFKL